MPLGLFTIVAIYLTTWWIVLFMILPIGLREQNNAPPPTDGSQWGAPENPNLKKKFITTTWVATIIWALIVIVVWTGIVPLPEINTSRLPAL